MTFLMVLLVLLAFVAILGVFALAVEALVHESPIKASALGMLAVVSFAGFLTFIMSQSDNDPYWNTLCLAGHQEYRTEHRAKGGTRTFKVWICDQWEVK